MAYEIAVDDEVVFGEDLYMEIGGDEWICSRNNSAIFACLCLDGIGILRRKRKLRIVDTEGKSVRLPFGMQPRKIKRITIEVE